MDKIKGTSWTFTMSIPVHLRKIIKPGIDTINGEEIESINQDTGSWTLIYGATSGLQRALDIQSLED